MNKSEIISFIKGILLRLVILAALFFVAMVAVTAIPADAIRGNVVSSVAENTADKVANAEYADEAAQASTYTTDLMFSILLSQDQDRLVQSAMDGAYYWEDGNEGSLLVFLDKPELAPSVVYSYYWHGWATILKPLLLVFDYASIKRLFAVVFVISIVALAGLFDRALRPRRAWLFAAAIAAAIALLRGLDAVTVLPFFFTIEIAVLGSCWVVWASMRKRRETRRWAYLGLFTIGALTSFFDFLITPLITYALPALCLLLVERLNPRESTRQKNGILDVVVLIVATGACWLVGYAGLWAMKWVFASIVLGYNVIQEALNEILFRVNATDTSQWATVSDVSAAKALKHNIKAAFPTPIIITGALVIIAAIVTAAVQHRKIDWPLVAGLVIIAALPYAWYAVAANHSQIHYYFTCRNQIATAAALLSACAYGAFVAKRPERRGKHASTPSTMEKQGATAQDREQLI